MILVDSSVWIDFLRDKTSPQVARLVELIKDQRIAMGDLILAEVLQGILAERDFEDAQRMFVRLPMLEIGGEAVAFQAARNYRILRARGITPRKTIDTLIATRCMIDGLPLLFSDRDFEPFVEHLGLVDAMRLG